MAAMLRDTGQAERFDLFVPSDPVEAAEPAERAAWARLAIADVLPRHGWHVAVGLLLLAISLSAPRLGWWLAPVTPGLLASPLLAAGACSACRQPRSRIRAAVDMGKAAVATRDRTAHGPGAHGSARCDS